MIKLSVVLNYFVVQENRTGLRIAHDNHSLCVRSGQKHVVIFGTPLCTLQSVCAHILLKGMALTLFSSWMCSRCCMKCNTETQWLYCVISRLACNFGIVQYQNCTMPPYSQWSFHLLETKDTSCSPIFWVHRVCNLLYCWSCTKLGTRNWEWNKNREYKKRNETSPVCGLCSGRPVYANQYQCCTRNTLTCNNN